MVISSAMQKANLSLARQRVACGDRADAQAVYQNIGLLRTFGEGCLKGFVI
jgi:hypothetical protein